MKNKNLLLYILTGSLSKLIKYYTSRCQYGRAAFALIGASAVVSSASLVDLGIKLVDTLDTNRTTPIPTCGITGSDTLNFLLSIVMLLLAVHFIKKSTQNKKQALEEGKLIFEKNSGEIATIKNSRILAYCGSVTQISNISLVVTSENTDLNLGSLTGTSVSGRIRNLAATRSPAGDVTHDNLEKFIRKWKESNNRYDNFQLGTCIECDSPYEARSRGIETIIFAVAIKKNPNGIATIDETAINNIVHKTIDTAINKDIKSLFIPIFGLGSGNTSQSAIQITSSAVKAKLDTIEHSLDIYLGVYRISDLAELCLQVSKA
ncbi:hypothetical protein ABNM62_00155 [Pseudomonas syringae]|uniref:hypothetical protein n=1 Tax=Pseudomonas syringae TaxID=317 RepID=UPI0032D8CF2F